MYGHPRKPDPYAERQPIPPYDDDDASVPLACLLITVPVFFLAFAMGYVSGVMGWF